MVDLAASLAFVRRGSRKIDGFVVGFPVLLALLACGDGGANANQRGVGNEPGGVKLGIGDIAVAPQGGYVVFKSGEGLKVGWPLRSEVASLPVASPTRLAFSSTRPVVYVGSTANGDGLVAVDVAERTALWTTPIPDASTSSMRVVASPDDRFVVVGSGRSLRVIDAAGGGSKSEHDFAKPIVDIDIVPDSTRALVTTLHEWMDPTTPNTVVVSIDLGSGIERRIDVPNCSDDLVVTPDGRRAFLAPTTCRRDPVSLIELEGGTERFVRNLPGFGPVAMAHDGTMAVAFFDSAQLDASLFDDPAKIPDSSDARYQLMLLDVATLAYDFVPVGDDLPRYAMTPDGGVLLVDTSWFTSEPVRLFDTATRAFKSLSGPAILLDNFSMSSNSVHAYALQAGVYDVDIGAAVVSSLPVPFVPENLNISADDKQLYLRKDAHHICVFDLAEQRCSSELAYAAPDPVVAP